MSDIIEQKTPATTPTMDAHQVTHDAPEQHQTQLAVTQQQVPQAEPAPHHTPTHVRKRLRPTPGPRCGG